MVLKLISGAAVHPEAVIKSAASAASDAVRPEAVIKSAASMASPTDKKSSTNHQQLTFSIRIPIQTPQQWFLVPPQGSLLLHLCTSQEFWTLPPTRTLSVYQEERWRPLARPPGPANIEEEMRSWPLGPSPGPGWARAFPPHHWSWRPR